MSIYLVLKLIHIVTAVLSILGFMLRGIWMMQSSPMLAKKPVKIIPHINDTFLLASAIALVVITAQYPGPAAWINAKIIGLVLYIVLGVIALKRGKTKTIRIIAWLAAIAVFAFIMSTAFSKTVVLPI